MSNVWQYLGSRIVRITVRRKRVISVTFADGGHACGQRKLVHHLVSILWALGGRDSHGFHNSTECFHPALNTWTFGASTNTRRFAAAGRSLGGALYITGGFDASTYIASAERLDPREKKWSKVGCVVIYQCNINVNDVSAAIDAVPMRSRWQDATQVK